jgi:hypothetical protein
LAVVGVGDESVDVAAGIPHATSKTIISRVHTVRCISNRFVMN